MKQLLLLGLVSLLGIYVTIVGLFYSVAENSVAALLATVIFGALCYFAFRGIDQ